MFVNTAMYYNKDTAMRTIFLSLRECFFSFFPFKNKRILEGQNQKTGEPDRMTARDRQNTEHRQNQKTDSIKKRKIQMIDRIRRQVESKDKNRRKTERLVQMEMELDGNLKEVIDDIMQL